MCDARVQGYVLGGLAYEAILMPQMRCFLRACLDSTSMHLTPEYIDVVQHGFECMPQPKLFFGPSDRDPNEVCDIDHTDNLLYYHPGYMLKNTTKRHDLGRTRIALGFPATSKGSTTSSVLQMAFPKIFLPSFVSTLTKHSSEKYHYAF